MHNDCKIPKAAIEGVTTGGATTAADRVCCQGYRVIGSDVDLLGDLDSVVDLDAEVAHRTLNFRMAEQKLHGSEVAGSPIDQHGFRPSQRMRAELRRIEPDACHPFLHQPGVLPGRQSPLVATACEEELPGFRLVSLK